MQSSVTFDAFIFHLLFIILPLLMGTIHAIWKRNTPGFSLIDCFLTYFLILTAGVQSLLVGYFQIVQPELVNEYVGWIPCPLSTQLGLAHLAFGILGILCYWFKHEWRTATGVGYSLYLLMTAYVHIRSVYFVHTYELGHSGPTLLSDVFVPICILTLLILRK